MSFESFETIGIVVSLLGLVLTLGGLALRTHQNTQSLRSLNYSRAVDRLAALQGRLSGDAEMAKLFAVGLRDPDRMSTEDRIRLTWVFYEMFGAFEFIHDQANAGALPSDVWDRWAETVAWWLSFPAVQAWWHARPTPFNPRFTRFVEDRLAEPRMDEEAARRWAEFVRAGESSGEAGESSA